MRDGTNAAAEELVDLLNKVVEGWTVERTEAAFHDQAKRVTFSERAGQRFEARVVSNDRETALVLRCSSPEPVSEEDIRLMRKVASVLDADLRVVGNPVVAQDLWGALKETRFLRAAARLSPFSTDPLIRWVDAFEAATRQTYEGNRFTGSVILAMNVDSFRAHAGDRFHQFAREIRLEQALLKEKWLKPFLQEGEFALVSVSHRGMVIGFVDTTVAWRQPQFRGPTEDLDGLYGFLRPGVSILRASPAGDIQLVLPNGTAFVKSQGEWRYPTWRTLRDLLVRRLGAEVGPQILAQVVSASYKRRGSLYVFLDNGVDPSEMVADHNRPERSASILRSTLTGRGIRSSRQRRVVNAASRIDGAIIFDSRGYIVDVATMVGEPLPEALAAAGIDGLQRFGGARSTAAWNASVHGLAIKVSDDGPVDAYEYGQLVFHSG
ncbi:hypothetical protein [Mycobacteroides abscessus]|uniref:hypothetical protein n=1 Tax=Mycobacteroides abscessus TaxID=36809 RepID=UPI00078DC9D7|nr:hypothetical protein [Mycobacteroides abscessus]AMU23400.1 hypothetical protein A3N95_23110 [Mycobacteroides abscessus]RIS88668.1 hypothetical protein D2E44_09695 [Mycobacteroides abscessus]SIA31042.1 Uncharacterised protein [Mycobacteroides abscessus subsp. bolletii]SIA78891.1 Uncharacterised protein [Mycobacteroides abscessus subsp. bolletii]